MTTVTLEFDPEQELLLVLGAAPHVVRHPLLAAYLHQVGASIGSDQLTFPTTADQLTRRYQTLTQIFRIVGVAVSATGHVSDVLSRVEDEEQRFAKFSKDAYQIWHSQIESSQFREFMQAVERYCVGRTLYRKQLFSAFHLAFAQNACNFSVPGAGKTSIVYAAYSYLKSLAPTHERVIDRLLVVGPLSSFKAWEDEYADIFLRPANSQRVSGQMPSSERADYLRGVKLGSRDVEVTLTSYPTLASSEEDFRVFLSRPDRRTMMVLDEAHYIKRGDGYWSAAALRLASLAASRVVLTGTPAPNGYEDLSNLFKFIYPSRDVVGFPAASLRAMSDGAMPSAVSELKENIQPFFTRIRKSDLGLPIASEKRIEVPMFEVQERIYRGLEAKIVPQLRLFLDEPVSPPRVRARLVRLRQASVNPELLLKPLEDEEIFDGDGDFSVQELEIGDLVRGFVAERDLNRLKVCREIAIEVLENQGKVLIWSYFLGNLKRLHEMFSGDAPFVEVLTGATPVSSGEADCDPTLGTREEIITRFHKTEGKAILIANPQAVGESISLHKACRSAIYFDRDFNAGRYIQSKDRIHRYNPNGGEPVTYYHLVTSTTVDRDIDARLVAKERRLSELVDSDDIPLFTADGDAGADDIREILDAYERRKTTR